MKYGSQSARDATAKKEKWIEEAADARVEWLKALDEVLNRPIGSIVPTGKEARLQDWMARLQNVEASAEEIRTTRIPVIGFDRAIYELLKWDAQMQRLAGGDEDA